MIENLESKNTRVIAILLRAASILFLLCAGLYNQWLFKLIKPHSQSGKVFLEAVRSAQLDFLIIALGFFLLSWLMVKWPLLRALARRDFLVNLGIFGLVLFTMLALLEFALRPLVVRSRSEIFVQDNELGWKLRPNAEDLYAGAFCKINSKGVVGPELEYAKPDHLIRLLYLGDSVTFGYGCQNYRQAFPYVVEGLLKDRTGIRVETVNAAVSGYNTRQEYNYLSREGIKYHPDIVVLAFILNDVTERLSYRKGHADTLTNGLTEPELSWRQRLLFNSGIIFFTRKLTWLHVESRGAQEFHKEFPNARLVEQILTAYPDVPNVKQAWESAQGDLSRIARFCRERQTPFMVVTFPYEFQLADAANQSGPQKILCDFCRRENIPILDLLPEMTDRMRLTGEKPTDFFRDLNHPTVSGHQFAGERIADFIISQGLIHPQ